MYDLRIGMSEAPDVAIEVTRVQDHDYTLVWKKGPEKGAQHWAVDGVWSIGITVHAVVRKLQSKLEPLLRLLNARGIHHVMTDECLQRTDPEIFSVLSDYGINAICREVGPHNGTVYFRMDGEGDRGEMVNTTGEGISSWLGDYLRADARKDNLQKLRCSGAKSCHIFLMLTLAGTPSAVSSYLVGSLDPLPMECPDLPSPVKAAWLMPSWGGTGLFWTGSEWQIVEGWDEEAISEESM